MTDTFSTFLTAYTKAPQDIKNLIDSEEIGIFVDTLIKDSTPALPKRKLLVILSNRVLTIISDSQMISELEKIGVVAPEKIAQIKNFITLKTSAISSSIISSEITETEVAIEIADAEADLKKVSPIRTMAGDSKQVISNPIPKPNYTYAQSALINEKK